jgi:hypothetical protein
MGRDQTLVGIKKNSSRDKAKIRNKEKFHAKIMAKIAA